MRYLTENNDYEIIYREDLSYILPYPDGLINAYLKDKKTNKVIFDEQPFKESFEKSLMKLGKRLIKKWRNQKE